MQTSDLRELDRVYSELTRSGHRQYKTQLGYLYTVLISRPRFKGLLDTLVASASGFEADAWIQQRVIDAKQTGHQWPDDESAKLRALLRLVELAAGPNADPVAVGGHLIYTRNIDEMAQAFTRQIVFPLVDYLQTRMGADSAILFRLERMRRQIEWFEQPKLYAAYLADTKNGEALYDSRVREILFAEGIDYPFSQPESPSGWADVIADVETDDPLVCEIKLFDDGQYGVTALRKGVGQALRYAHDYGKPVAHVVVFNLSDVRLDLPSDERGRPPRLHLEGVTVFLVVVQAKPRPSASKDQQRRVRAIQREQLVPPANDDFTEGTSLVD